MKAELQRRERGGSRPPLFIVSTGRSGSNMLARVLGQHPTLCALHEPRPHLNAEAYARWSGSHPASVIQRHVRAKRDALIGQIQENNFIYVESSHYCSHLIPLLRAQYGAKFVHLYRDGRRFVRSGLDRAHWYDEGAQASSWADAAKQYMKRHLRRTYFVDFDGASFADHRLRPPRALATRFEKVVWLWVEINQAILNGLDHVPEGAKMSLQLEDFGEDALRALHDFAEVRVLPDTLEQMLAKAEQRPNKTEDRTAAAPEAWSAWRQRRFKEIAGAMMAALGYAV